LARIVEKYSLCPLWPPPGTGQGSAVSGTCPQGHMGAEGVSRGGYWIKRQRRIHLAFTRL